MMYLFLIFQTGAVYTDYYQDNDLTIGSVINVWGRKFRICDCDEFTKEYYKSKYGLRKISWVLCFIFWHFILISVIQEAFLFGVEAGNLYFLLSF